MKAETEWLTEDGRVLRPGNDGTLYAVLAVKGAQAMDKGEWEDLIRRMAGVAPAPRELLTNAPKR